MVEKLSKQSKAVVFQTPDGILVWDILENSNTGAEMIKERESRGN